jgi:hypothetical protein
MTIPPQRPMSTNHTGPSRIERHTITPEIARRLLDATNGNRDLTPGAIRRWTEAIRQGRWQLTHQGIAITGDSFDEPGRLLDGQHRLHAVCEANTAVEFWVAFGCPESTFNAIDVGKARTGGDMMTIRGFKNAKRLWTAWQYAWCWERGAVGFSGTTRDDLIAELLERYPSLTTMVPERQSTMLQAGPLTFICYITDDEDFVADLKANRHGTAGGELGSQYTKWTTARRSLDRRNAVGIAVKARNDHHAGRSSSRYAVKQSEAFPTPEWTPPLPYKVRAEDDEKDTA